MLATVVLLLAFAGSSRAAESNGTSDPGDPVFVNREGRRETVSNLGRRLKTVLRRADARLAVRGMEPIGQRVTPYSFRRLYASLRYALRDDPVYVAGQMGHADGGGLSMGVYATALRRRERLTGVTLSEFDGRAGVGLDGACHGRRSRAASGGTAA